MGSVGDGEQKNNDTIVVWCWMPFLVAPRITYDLRTTAFRIGSAKG